MFLFCRSQPLVKIKFIYDDIKYNLIYDDTSCDDSTRRWNMFIMTEGGKCDKGVLFYLCNQVVERDCELISINEGFRDIYKILSTSEELGKYFPEGGLEYIEKRVKERLIRISKDELMPTKRANNLRRFLDDQKGRLNMTNIIFYTENGKDINFYKRAMPSLILTATKDGLIKTSELYDDVLLKDIKVSIVRYMYDILELLNSDDPDILADYYNNGRILANFEDFIIEILAHGKLDVVTEEIYEDLRNGTSKSLLD